MLWGSIYARENGVIMVDNNNVEEVDNIKQLREEYKKLKAENKEFKANAMSSALSTLGLEADKGIGKAVTKLYDGDVTVEAISEYVAKEFGEVSSSEPTEQKDISENVVQAQTRVEQLNQLGVNAEPVDISQEFAAFINNSETSTRDSINAKLRMMDNLKDKK